MNGSARRRPWIISALDLLMEALAQVPPCIVCGRGPAETGWVVDAIGGIHGSCAACAGADARPVPTRVQEDRPATMVRN